MKENHGDQINLNKNEEFWFLKKLTAGHTFCKLLLQKGSASRSVWTCDNFQIPDHVGVKKKPYSGQFSRLSLIQKILWQGGLNLNSWKADKFNENTCHEKKYLKYSAELAILLFAGKMLGLHDKRQFN